MLKITLNFQKKLRASVSILLCLRLVHPDLQTKRFFLTCMLNLFINVILVLILNNTLSDFKINIIFVQSQKPLFRLLINIQKVENRYLIRNRKILLHSYFSLCFFIFLLPYHRIRLVEPCRQMMSTVDKIKSHSKSKFMGQPYGQFSPHSRKNLILYTQILSYEIKVSCL